MKKKLISALAVGLSCIMLLGGCGKGNNAGSNNTSDNDTQVEEPTGEISDATEGYIPGYDPSKNVAAALNRKDTLVIGVDAPDEVFNPLYAESAYDTYVVESMFEGMVGVDEQGLPTENIATWKVSDDGLTYTFTLKDDLKFWDGSPLTTEDVAFTYTVMCDGTYDGPSDIVNTTKVKGSKAYQEGTATSVEGIKVIDEKTIEFTLEEVNSEAIYDFSQGIISKAHYGAEYAQGKLDYIKKFHKDPLGSGQYKFVSSSAGQEVVLEANESYFLGAPKIKNLVYKVTSEDTRMQMLQTGEIDMDMVTVNQDNVNMLKEAGFLDLHIFPTNGYGYIGMNISDPKFADAKVRQALAYGLNRAEIVEACYAGGFADVINAPQSKVSWSFTEPNNKYEFDLEKAKQLLDEAGWTVGADGIREKDGVKFEIKFTASTPNPVNEAIIPIAQQNYAELGIKFEAEQMDFNAVREKVNSGNFQMFFMAWGLTPKVDPSGVFGTEGAQNKTFYSNAKVDELSAAGLKETDQAKRKEIYAELWQELNQDLPYIFLYQRRDMWTVNSRVKGFENQITPYKKFTASLYKLTLE